jgi:hypothetical protein
MENVRFRNKYNCEGDNQMREKESSQAENNKVAGKQYDPSFYNSSDQTEKGIAITHEQSSDTLTEGTVDGVIEDVNGKDVNIPRKGYED